MSGQEHCQRLITNQCCSVDVYNQTVDGQTSGTVTAYSIQGNTIDRDAKQNGSGVAQDVSHTLNSTDRHGVASVDCRNGTENENVNVTLQAKANGGQSLNCGTVIREKK